MLLMNSDLKLFDDSMGVSSLRFLGGVIVGDMGDILLWMLKMLLTMLLLVNCCFFCLIVSAKVSTFLIFAALFSSE